MCCCWSLVLLVSKSTFSREERGVPAKAKALVTYDEESQLLAFETCGQDEWDFVSLRFAISAVRHVAMKFQGGQGDVLATPGSMYVPPGRIGRPLEWAPSEGCVDCCPPAARICVLSDSDARGLPLRCSWDFRARTTVLGIRNVQHPFVSVTITVVLDKLCVFVVFCDQMYLICSNLTRRARSLTLGALGTSYR